MSKPVSAEREGGEGAGFIVDPGRRLVILTLGKKVTVAGIRVYVERLRADRFFDASFSEIADLRNVEEVELEAEDFLRLSDRIDPFSIEAKRAFVVRTPAQAHAARMHKILRTQRHFEIFHSVEAAERWIES